MNYLAVAIYYLLAGWLMGFIQAWNRKFYIILLMCGVVYVVVVGFVIGPSEVLAGISVLEFIYNVFFMVIGVFCGEWSYKRVFEK